MSYQTEVKNFFIIKTKIWKRQFFKIYLTLYYILHIKARKVITIARRINSSKNVQDTWNINIYCTPLPEYTETVRKTKLHTRNKVNSKKKNRSRNIIWFNPPYTQSVKTNIAAKGLSLMDKHFGKSNQNKYFNRKTIKLSYSCMPNMEAVISGHNRKLLNPKIIYNRSAIRLQNRRPN